jgi:2-oxoglutarate ferredoxin oxidoreductase subunit gamma
MREEIIFAGFGGQGIILSGMMVCLAAMREGRQVSHIPSYGAEMRGGTANCSVVVSDHEIASPMVPHPSICVAMNAPSLAKFEPRMRPEALLIYNSSLIDGRPARTDLAVHAVAANEIAEEEGSARAANMVTLGLLVKLRPEIASLDSLVASLDRAVSSRNRALNEINVRCLRRGYSLE